MSSLGIGGSHVERFVVLCIVLSVVASVAWIVPQFVQVVPTAAANFAAAPRLAPECGICPSLDDAELCRGAIAAAVANAVASTPLAPCASPTRGPCPSPSGAENCSAAVFAAEMAAATAATAACPISCPAAPVLPAASSAPGIDSAASTHFGGASLVSLPWQRRVTFRSWDGVNSDSPLLCRNAQASIVPRSPTIFDRCPGDPNYGGVGTPGWSTLLSKLLEVSCAYSPNSPIERRYFWNTPSPSASVFIVFVQAQPVGETLAARKVRKALTRFTLNRLRDQFGSTLELMVVELFDVELDEERDFGLGVVNMASSHLNFEGQDWAMYQLGINSISHRLAQFRWVIVMNDQMVGPFASLPGELAAAESADMYITSSLPGCCIRGFFIAFRSSLVATPGWKTYWERVAFPCEKLGPMFLGEGALNKEPLSWTNCVTSTLHPLSSTNSLATMTATSSPFIYRKGLVAAFPPHASNSPGSITNADALFFFLANYSVKVHVEPCKLRRRERALTPFNGVVKLLRAATEMKPGDGSVLDANMADPINRWLHEFAEGFPVQ
jgi:hypothetical protein